MTAPNLENLNFYIVIPAAATNYVTNPTPYRATTGYTAFDPDSAGTIAIEASDAYTRRGPKCIKITTLADHDAGVYFSSVTGVDGTAYTFSADVLTTAGEPMVIAICSDVGGTVLAKTEFTATGYWQRPEVSLTGTAGNAGTWYLHVYRDGSSSNAYDAYTDGWQFEEASAATTFFTGDTKGFGAAPLEFYWDGTPHASISYRTADTRAGGSLLDMSSYATLAGVFGLGMGNFTQVYSELVSGGAYYQKHIRKPRTMSLLLQYKGSMSQMFDYKNAIIEACRPDYAGYDQPLVIRFQGTDSSDDEATNPLDIVCVPQFSHQDPPGNPATQDDLLTFTVLDSHLAGAYAEGKELDLYNEFTVADYIMRQSPSGTWTELDNSGTGVTGIVYDILEAPYGSINIAGNFTNSGGVAEADYLCKWTGSALDDVTGAADFNGIVYALARDASMNLYIGGAFTDAGDANGDGIVMWNGSALSSLGTGVAGGAVKAIAIEPNTGDVYIGGTFTSAGGVANTAKIAYWDISASEWKALGTGIGGTVTSIEALKFHATGYLYIGGNFENAAGTTGDYACCWEGGAFKALSSVELNGIVYDIDVDSIGRIFIGGAFTNAGGNADCDYIARYMPVVASTGLIGGVYYPIGDGLNGIVYDIYIRSYSGITSYPGIYAAGAFTASGSKSLDRLALYADGAWQSLDNLFPGTDPLYKVYYDSSGYLYVAGNYTGTAYTSAAESLTTEAFNSGNALVYPIIEVEGPGVLQSINNFTTGKSISFDDLTLQSDEIITMNLAPTNLSITSSWSERGNVLRYVNPGSNLSNFYMKPGYNAVNLFMPSGTSAATKAYLFWIPKFWNIEGSRYE